MVAAIVVLGIVVGAKIKDAYNSLLKQRRQYLTAQRKQQEKFYAPLEMLLRVNKRKSDRYTKVVNILPKEI